MNKKTVLDYNVGGKKVFLRADLNVPLDDSGNPTELFRIKKSLPTINQIVENGGTAVVASHLGRPGGEPDDDLRMDGVARELQNELGQKVTKLDDCIGDEVEEEIENADPKSVYLLENLRFYPGEKENKDSFARQLAYLGDIYINDAFGTCHRRHASIVGVPNYIQQAGAGLLLRDEMKYLSELLESPEEPFVLLLGGAKVKDKVGMIKNLLPNLDCVLVGGAMSYPFMKAKGLNPGEYELDNELIEAAEEILESAESEGVDVELPPDHLVTDSLENGNGALRILPREIDSGWTGGDIGPDSITSYRNELKDAGSLFWNGPLGIFEQDNFSFGTELVAKALPDLEETVKVTGGGDTVAALDKFDVLESIDHASTGGGALLQFMERRTLPGIDALPEK